MQDRDRAHPALGIEVERRYRVTGTEAIVQAQIAPHMVLLCDGCYGRAKGRERLARVARIFAMIGVAMGVAGMVVGVASNATVLYLILLFGGLGLFFGLAGAVAFLDRSLLNMLRLPRLPGRQLIALSTERAEIDRVLDRRRWRRSRSRTARSDRTRERAAGGARRETRLAEVEVRSASGSKRNARRKSSRGSAVAARGCADVEIEEGTNRFATRAGRQAWNLWVNHYGPAKSLTASLDDARPRGTSVPRHARLRAAAAVRDHHARDAPLTRIVDDDVRDVRTAVLRAVVRASAVVVRRVVRASRR